MAEIQKISIDGVEYDIVPKIIQSTADWWNISMMGVRCDTLAQAAVVAGLTTDELTSIFNGSYGLPIRISRQPDMQSIEYGGTIYYEKTMQLYSRDKQVEVTYEQHESEDGNAEYVTKYITQVWYQENYPGGGIGFIFFQDANEDIYQVIVYGFLYDDPEE